MPAATESDRSTIGLLPAALKRHVAYPAVPLWAGVFVIVLLGTALRLAGASGDLALDEIWTFQLLGRIDSIDQIFWRISHDNNHYLNSVYLYLVGPDASPLLARSLSIALGAAAIFAAAAFNARHGTLAALATALLFAMSFPMVTYGSEARGYMGLVLFTILAVIWLERRLNEQRHGVALGLAILLGTLFHVTMLETVAVAGFGLYGHCGDVPPVLRSLQERHSRSSCRRRGFCCRWWCAS